MKHIVAMLTLIFALGIHWAFHCGFHDRSHPWEDLFAPLLLQGSIFGEFGPIIADRSKPCPSPPPWGGEHSAVHPIWAPLKIRFNDLPSLWVMAVFFLRLTQCPPKCNRRRLMGLNEEFLRVYCFSATEKSTKFAQIYVVAGADQPGSGSSLPSDVFSRVWSGFFLLLCLGTP